VGTVSFFFLASFSIKTITILHLPFHLRVKLLDGTKFDSSRDKGRTFNFFIGTKQVIRGTFLFQWLSWFTLIIQDGTTGWPPWARENALSWWFPLTLPMAQAASETCTSLHPILINLQHNYKTTTLPLHQGRNFYVPPLFPWAYLWPSSPPFFPIKSDWPFFYYFYPSSIPANSTLVFDVELLEVGH